MVTAVSAITRPIRAPRSSSTTTGSSGFFERRMNCHQLASPLIGRASWIAVRNDQLSRTRAKRRMPMATRTDSSSWGCRIFSTPSKIAKAPPRLKSTSATTKAQKYRSRP